MKSVLDESRDCLNLWSTQWWTYMSMNIVVQRRGDQMAHHELNNDGTGSANDSNKPVSVILRLLVFLVFNLHNYNQSIICA